MKVEPNHSQLKALFECNSLPEDKLRLKSKSLQNKNTMEYRNQMKFKAFVARMQKQRANPHSPMDMVDHDSIMYSKQTGLAGYSSTIA